MSEMCSMPGGNEEGIHKF